MTNNEEQAYIRGHRAALLRVLKDICHELGYDDPVVESTRYIGEREEAIAVLRRLCAERGDNDWPNDLHLADIIDKHLGRYLSES